MVERRMSERRVSDIDTRERVARLEEKFTSFISSFSSMKDDIHEIKELLEGTDERLSDLERKKIMLDGGIDVLKFQAGFIGGLGAFVLFIISIWKFVVPYFK